MSEPVLRFKEFTGQWKTTVLGNFIKERAEISNEEFPVYSLTIEDGVTPKTDRYQREHLVSNKESAYKIVQKNDFAFNPMNLRFGAIAQYKGNQPVRVSKYYNIFTCDSSVNSRFFEYYFKTPVMIGYYDTMSTGSLVEKRRVHFGNFIKFAIPAPTLQEQTKIANFLTVVDEKILQLTRKYDLLTQYKKGVMHRIFSQQLHFKDDYGQKFPEWELIELNKIAAKVTIKNKKLSVRTVLTNSALQGIVSQADYFDRDIANQNNLEGYYVVEVDDFVYNPRISANAPVGPIKRNNLTTGVMSPLYTVFRFTKGNLDFLNHYFHTSYWHDYLKSIANSGARHDRMNISNENFFDLPVPFPCEREQSKIANFLTAIDDKLTHTQNQLAAAKQYKQGLLQQMFV